MLEPKGGIHVDSGMRKKRAIFIFSVLLVPILGLLIPTYLMDSNKINLDATIGEMNASEYIFAGSLLGGLFAPVIGVFVGELIGDE